MPSLSISDGKERIVTSKPETIHVFGAAGILGGLERMEADPELKAEVKQAREAVLKIIRRYGDKHLDADGYPKETSKQAAANKV